MWCRIGAETGRRLWLRSRARGMVYRRFGSRNVSAGTGNICMYHHDYTCTFLIAYCTVLYCTSSLQVGENNDVDDDGRTVRFRRSTVQLPLKLRVVRLSPPRHQKSTVIHSSWRVSTDAKIKPQKSNEPLLTGPVVLTGTSMTRVAVLHSPILSHPWAPQGQSFIDLGDRATGESAGVR